MTNRLLILTGLLMGFSFLCGLVIGVRMGVYSERDRIRRGWHRMHEKDWHRRTVDSHTARATREGITRDEAKRRNWADAYGGKK